MSLRVSFSDGASETFRSYIEQIKGFGVTVTTQEDETIEGVLAGPAGGEWLDEIAIYPVPDGELYGDLADYYNQQKPRVVRVKDILIH